jgi:hypothetical protein
MLRTDARPQYRKLWWLMCWTIVFTVTSLALKSEAVTCEQPGGLCHLYESGTRTLETLKEGQEKQQLSLFLIRPPLFPRAWHLQEIKVLRSLINGIRWVMSRQCYVWDWYREIVCVCDGPLASLSLFLRSLLSDLSCEYLSSYSEGPGFKFSARYEIKSF